MPQAEMESLIAGLPADLAGLKFVPSPGRQTEAYLSNADVLLYGGAGGGGKTALGIGLALTAHRRSFILRRHYGELSALIDETIRFNGSKDGFNGSPPPSLVTVDGRRIDFGACQYAGDELKFMGIAHDLLVIDEAAHFLESQVRNLIGWVRTTAPGQRTRVVLATNPPLTSEGDWLISMFAPWLDPKHRNPAKHGELRWFITSPDGEEIEVESGDFSARYGVTPMSRTFIPATLADNPFLASTDYRAKLDSLPEPMRSAIRDGNFMMARQDSLWQVIPSDWVRAAQARWTPHPPAGVPMCALAADIAQGGSDRTVIAARYDGWYAPLIVEAGTKTPTGNEVAGLVVGCRRDGATVILDMGGGYGGAAMLRLKDNGIDCIGYKGAEGSVKRTNDGKLPFVNRRSEAYWKLREALDPSQAGGSPVMLPPDPELFADLTAPTWEETSRGIRLESKEDLCARIGRSPDKGDAVVMAWSGGSKTQNIFGGFSQMARSRPSVFHGHDKQRLA